MKYSLYLTAVFMLSLFAAQSVAHANCRISNRTKYSFKVTSGNTSNQSLGANTTTSIDDGKIKAKSKSGKSFGGSCNNGDSLIVTEEDGVIIMQLK